MKKSTMKYSHSRACQLHVFLCAFFTIFPWIFWFHWLRYNMSIVRKWNLSLFRLYTGLLSCRQGTVRTECIFVLFPVSRTIFLVYIHEKRSSLLHTFMLYCLFHFKAALIAFSDTIKKKQFRHSLLYSHFESDFVLGRGEDWWKLENPTMWLLQAAAGNKFIIFFASLSNICFNIQIDFFEIAHASCIKLFQ